ncbi:Abi family protein [Billgrantia kenyensis]|uniref:Abi family protein n=1 Tax=Billgrantia kenyensis TaxID=321266 RepID=A0A7V9W2X0_9GAMM|nr:Abi family protein [Halomonas kenyensis]MBA2780074.1 Abi family protein [Halomonas kenyensis]MCG6661947.1 Abi family protein [Halomonas kenyensis]
MDFIKPATTIEQQIDLLKSRGMQVEDDAQAHHYLSHLNYYRLTAYWLPFEVDHDTHQFRPGTRFNDVLNLYVFDRELRLLLLDAIERIEVSVRAQWAYQMGHRYGPHSYLDAALATRGDWHARHLASLEKEVARSDEIFIQHYQSTYRQPKTPPIWAVSEVMSMGLLSRWITQLRPSDRASIAKTYRLDQSVLKAFIRHLTYVRNLCAHHSRVWNRRFTVTMKLPTGKPAVLVPLFHPDEPRKIYNTLVMLAYCLDLISPGHHWKQRLGTLLGQHIMDVTHMGFPPEWEQQAFWLDAAHAREEARP